MTQVAVDGKQSDTRINTDTLFTISSYMRDKEDMPMNDVYKIVALF